MKIIDPSVFISKSELSSIKLSQIERYGRVCYKSEIINSNNSSADAFIRKLIASKHESVLEHEKASVHAIVDRGVSHEIVRHRIASYSQESTRYCNYGKDKFGNEITLIRPFFYDLSSEAYAIWEKSCKYTEMAYLELLKQGTAQEARSVLPNSLKTEMVITYNFREWRHFFNLRCAASAHPQMRQITIPLLLKFKDYLPCLFDDIDYDRSFPEYNYAKIIET